MAVQWSFKDYETVDGKIPIRHWIKTLPGPALAEFETRVNHLTVTAVWTIDDGAKPLDREGVGLTELQIDFSEWAPHGRKGKKRRFRPVGLQIPEQRQFLFLAGCEKAGGVYAPADAFVDAVDYWTKWKNGLGKAHDHISR